MPIRAKQATVEMEDLNLFVGEMTVEVASSPAPTSIHLVRWHPFLLGFQTQFWRVTHQLLAVGVFITRDWTGRLLNTSSAHYGVTTILAAEARAVRDSLNTAIQAGYRHTIVEGDNKTDIHALEE